MFANSNLIGFFNKSDGFFNSDDDESDKANYQDHKHCIQNCIQLYLHDYRICIPSYIKNEFSGWNDSDEEYNNNKFDPSFKDPNIAYYTDGIEACRRKFDKKMHQWINMLNNPLGDINSIQRYVFREAVKRREMRRICSNNSNPFNCRGITKNDFVALNKDSMDNIYFIITIELTGITPKIYRQVKISPKLSLAVLHDKVITPLFGYKRDYHAYQYLASHRERKDISFGPTLAQSCDIHHVKQQLGWHKAGRYMIDSQFVYISDFLININDKLKYIYDLGDLYHHTITLNKVVLVHDSVVKTVKNKVSRHRKCKYNSNVVRCKRRVKHNKTNKIVTLLRGARNGPPENTSGNAGYVNLLNKIAKIENDTIESMGGVCRACKDKNFEFKSQIDESIKDILNAPNILFDYNKNETNSNIKDIVWFQSEKFNKKELQFEMKKCFYSRLSSQTGMLVTGGQIHDPDDDPDSMIFGGVSKHKIYSNILHQTEKRRRWCHNRKCKYTKDGRAAIRKMCKRCLSAFYCCRQCQKRHWNFEHRYYCFDFKNM